MSALLRRTALCAMAGMLVNAAICGAISESQPRYQARVAWVLPLMVLLAEANIRQRRADEAADQQREWNEILSAKRMDHAQIALAVSASDH
jgi:hypothetical protein